VDVGGTAKFSDQTDINRRRRIVEPESHGPGIETGTAH
jgi:hypothetical protein